MSDVEVSRYGIKAPWRRFIADSSTGFVVYLLLYLAYIFNWNVFGLQLCTIRGRVPDIHLISLAIILFFLALPLGLIINNIAWFLFQGLQNCVMDCLYQCNKGSPGYLKIMWRFDKTSIPLDLAGKPYSEIFKKWREIVVILNAFHKPNNATMDTPGSIGILFRNVAFVSLVVGASVVFGADDQSRCIGIVFYLIVFFGLIYLAWKNFPKEQGLRSGFMAKHCCIFWTIVLILAFFIGLLINHQSTNAIIISSAIALSAFILFFTLSCFCFMRQQLSTIAEAWAWSGERKRRPDGQSNPGRVIFSPSCTDDTVIQNIIWNLEYWYLKEGKSEK